MDPSITLKAIGYYGGKKGLFCSKGDKEYKMKR